MNAEAPQPPDRPDGILLEEVQAITRMMREHQDSITRLGRRRRGLILKLREHRITYREIAEAMGSTDQNVYKIIRDL